MVSAEREREKTKVTKRKNSTKKRKAHVKNLADAARINIWIQWMQLVSRKEVIPRMHMYGRREDRLNPHECIIVVSFRHVLNRQLR